eukprot:8474284-Pyramimonas_sp.AAC.1
MYGGAISSAYLANAAAVAGCSGATTLAKLLLLRPLLLTQQGRPNSFIRNVVDDVALQACGSPVQVAQVLAGAVGQLCPCIEGLHLPVNIKKNEAHVHA